MGSFGIPEEMQQAINESKAKEGKNTVTEEEAKEFTQAVKEDSSFDLGKAKEDTTEEVTEEKVEPTLEEILNKEIKELSTSLDITIDDDNIWSMLFEEELIKDNIIVIPDRFEVSFRTLNSNDNKAIDKKLELFSRDGFLEEGIKNEMTLNLLAHGVVKMGRPGKAKDMPSDIEERYKSFASLPTIVLDKIARKWNDFTRLTSAIIEKEFSQGN